MFNKKYNLFDMLNVIFMMFFSLTILYPFWSMLVDSLDTVKMSTRLGLKLWPSEFTFEAYEMVFEQKIIGVAYINTLIRVTAGTLLSVFFTFCAAYSVSKKYLPFKKTITTFIIFTMFFSGGLIPSYMLIQNLNLLDTRWVLIIPGLISAWNLIIMRNFMYSIPDSLEESAIIDGANEITILLKIIAPLSMPIIATVALWVAVGHWNAWFDAMIYIRDTNKIVLQLLLRRILIENQSGSMFDMAASASEIASSAKRVTETSIKAATVFVTIGPIIIVYPFAQKYFIKGIMLGSVKQ